MSYRINKTRKVVDVVGEADLDAIMSKVRKSGGKGWVIKTTLPLEFVERVVEKYVAKQDAEHHEPRQIGFRILGSQQEHGLVTGLPFSPPHAEE
jgi:hypothetical protein